MSGSGVEVELNMWALVELANLAEAKIARPLGERVVMGAGTQYRVDTWTREGIRGWARTRVWTDGPEAYRNEIREGTLARSLDAY